MAKLSQSGKQFLWYLCITFGLYAAAIGGCHLCLQTVTLVEMVSACKAVSLTMLVIVSEGIAEDIDPKKNGDVQKLSRLINFFAFLLVVLLVLKLLRVDFDHLPLRPRVTRLLDWTEGRISILSTIPIFSYAALNLWVGFVRRSEEAIRSWARCYLLLADCTCLIPLVFVLFMLEFPGNSTPADSEDFLGGAIAMIVFASNTVSKAIDEFVDADIATKLAAGWQTD